MYLKWKQLGLPLLILSLLSPAPAYTQDGFWQHVRQCQILPEINVNTCEYHMERCRSIGSICRLAPLYDAYVVDEFIFFNVSEPSNNGGNCPNNTSNPINIPTGNKYFKEVEGYSKLRFYRTYNSKSGAWIFLYTQRLIVHSDYTIVQRPDGKVLVFPLYNNTYLPPSQRRERLTFDGSIYTLTLSNNTYETYDSNGRLLSIHSLYDEPISLSYESNQITVSQGDGNLVLTINAEGQITQALFGNGYTVDYSYLNNNGVMVLSTMIDSDNSSQHYFYENTQFPTYITGIEDENGNRISSVQYDSQGRAISSEKGPFGSGIERTQIQYNADGTRTVTNALGKQSTYHFTQFNGEYKMTQVEGHPSANCAGANKNYTYDANGFMASKTDWANNTTTYVHNDRGQETSRTEASGTSQARTITTEWHTEFNLPVRIIEPERETVMSYDANGSLLSRTVNEREL